MKYLLAIILCFSMFSYAKDIDLNKINPDTNISIKARTLKTFVSTIESQQEIISDLQ